MGNPLDRDAVRGRDLVALAFVQIPCGVPTGLVDLRRQIVGQAEKDSRGARCFEGEQRFRPAIARAKHRSPSI